MPSDALSEALVVGGLALFRVGGLLLIAPLLSSRTIPVTVRSAFALGLTLLVLPLLPVVPSDFVVGPAVLAGELLIGLGIGMGAAVLVAGAELAGETLAVQTGLSGATTLNPLTGVGTSVLSQLLGFFVLLLLVVTGGHLVMIEALVRSWEVVPPGAPFDAVNGAWQLADLFRLLFSTGLQFAAPIIAAVSVGYVALGVLARTSPQLNMLAVAFPLQIGLGFLILAGALPLSATFYAAWPEHVSGLADRFLSSLMGG